MVTPVGPQQVYPHIEPSAPPLPTLSSNDQAISKIEVKEGFFSRIANAIKSLFTPGTTAKLKAKINEVKKIEDHKTTATAQARINDHKAIIRHLREADKYTDNHWKINLKIAQEHYAEGEYKEALDHLNKIPLDNCTKEMFYFKAVVLKKNENFLEAHRLYELLIGLKRPPENVTKTELMDELSELVEMWKSKANTTEEQLIIKDYFPEEVEEEVTSGMAPKVPPAGSGQDYFDMSRFPDAKFDPDTKSFQYLKKHIKKSDNLNTILKARDMSIGPERWKWDLRLAKEYDLMASKQENVKDKHSYYKEALDIISLQNAINVLSHAETPELLHIEAHLNWKMGNLDEAKRLFEGVKKQVKAESPLEIQVAQELTQLNQQIKERDDKIAKEQAESALKVATDRKEQNDKFLDLFNNSTKSIDQIFEGYSDDLRNEFVKTHGQRVTRLNLGNSIYVIDKIFKCFPNIKQMTLLNVQSANMIIELIGKGKIPHLETLDFSQIPKIITSENIDFEKLAANLICIPHLKSINLSGVKEAYRFLESATISDIESLDLSNIEFNNNVGFDNKEKLLALIPAKFPHLKYLNLSRFNGYVVVSNLALENLFKNIQEPADLESIDLSNDIYLKKAVMSVGDNLSKLPNIKTIKLNYKTFEGRIRDLFEDLTDIFGKVIQNLPEGSQLEDVSINIGDYSLSPDSLPGIAMKKILQDNLTKIPNLNKLVVNGYDWGPAIAEMRQAKQASMEKTDAPLVEQLNDNKPIKEFLNEQNMNWQQFQEFARRNQQTITTLNFNEFSHAYDLSWANKNEIYNLMTSLPNLVNISARECFDVADIVMELIAENKLKQLEVLDLSKIEMANNGAIALANHLENMPNLKQLILAENLIHDEGATALAEKLKFKGQQVLQGVLQEEVEEEAEPGAEPGEVPNETWQEMPHNPPEASEGFTEAS